VAERRAAPDDGERARERRRAVRQPGELALDAARDLLGAERAQTRRRLLGRRDPFSQDLGQEGAEQERVASGDGVAGACERSVGVRQPLPHQRLGGCRAKRVRAHRRLGSRGQQLGEQLGLTRELAAPYRTQHSDGELVDPARELGQPAQRRRVGPVDVVDHQQRRPALGQIADQPGQPVGCGMHGVTRRHGLGRIWIQRSLRQTGGADRQLSPARALARRPEQLPRDAPGGILLKWPAARPQDGHLSYLGCARGGPQEARLADPRGPFDHEHAAAAGAHSSQLTVEGGELGIPIEQHIAKDATAGRPIPRRQRSWPSPRCARRGCSPPSPPSTAPKGRSREPPHMEVHQ
jgi:hypothetical protein